MGGGVGGGGILLYVNKLTFDVLSEIVSLFAFINNARTFSVHK